MRAIILIVLVVMSLGAGLAKVLQMQQEVQFFDEAGLGLGPLMFLGLIQIVGGGLAIVTKTHTFGLLFIALGFFLSTIVIFLTGNIGFAFGSLVPVVLIIWLSMSRGQLTV